MKQLRIIIALVTPVIALTCLGATSAAAQYSRGGGFSAAGYGVRSWGMAGATVANGADESSAYWNPAMMSLLPRNRVGASYIDLVPGSDAQQGYLAYAHVLQRGDVDSPGLEYARHAFGIIYGNMRLGLADDKTYSENTFRLAYAFAPEYFLSVGFAFNALLSSSEFGLFDSRGTSVDAGVRVRVLERWTIGAIVRNAFSRILFDDGLDQSLDRSLTLGLAHHWSKLLEIEGDAVIAYGGISRLSFGGEGRLFNLIQLRAGVENVRTGLTRIVPHFGLGVSLGPLQVDYNANLDNEEAFGDTHRFGLALGL